MCLQGKNSLFVTTTYSIININQLKTFKEMKKFLLSVVTLLSVTMISAQAQTKAVLGDLDGDGKVTVDDITTLIDYYLNPQPVEPAETVFEEPSTAWGTPLATVKNAMADYEQVNEADEDGLLTLTYMGKDNALTYTYTFLNDQLVGSSALVGNVTMEQVDAQLQNTYTPVIQSDTLNAYLSEDGATVVFVSPMEYGNTVYFNVQYYDYNALYPDTQFYLPYLGFGSEREAVKDTLTAWGYGEPYVDNEGDAEYEYSLMYLVSNNQADYYYFYADSVITTPVLSDVQQLFIDVTVEEMSEIFTSELGYTAEGERVIGAEGEEVTVYDFLSPDETIMVTMLEDSVSDESGDYQLLYVLYYPYYSDEEGGEEAKSRTGKAQKLISHVKDAQKMMPAKMVFKAKAFNKIKKLNIAK